MSTWRGGAKRAAGHGLAALAAVAALPLATGALALRPHWRVGLGERLGALPRLSPGSIWIHAASVGEILAASRLVDRMRERGRSVFTSTVTLTGREVMRKNRPGVPCHLAPLDHPWCVDAALARVAPVALVLVETELWPSWIAAAWRRLVPVVLVSARLSDRSFPRYRRLERLVGPTLRRLHAVGARTEDDAARFRSLGADPDRVFVTGDLKLEIDTDPRAPAPDLDAVLGGTPLVVAGSTHAGEEAAMLDALDAAGAAGLDAALVLAPRRPERADEVARLVEGRGRRLRQRTRLGHGLLSSGEVLLLDTVGELPELYERADVAFVGGTLAPVGGHNVLEPARAGRPVLFGSHTENIRHAVELLERCGAGRAVEDGAALAEALVGLLREPEYARKCGEAGRRALEAHRGSAERAAELVESALTATPRV